MDNKVELGKTGLYIHPVGLGANKIGEENKETNTEYGGKIVSSAIESGLNFIDTAFMYDRGLSEEIIGKTLKENNWRNNVVLATKGAHKYTGDQVITDNSPEFLKQTVEDSLKRLQTDVIDLFYIHFPDDKTPKFEAIGALSRLKEAGKIRSIGVSNFTIDQLKEANQDGYLDVVQGNYNLLDRSAESELFPYFSANEISFVPYFPLASGLLAGKYTKGTVLSESQKKRPQFQGEAYIRHLEKVEKIREIAVKHNVDVSHVVLAFYLSRDQIDSVIPGARNSKQVVNNLKAADVKLTSDDIQTIDELYPLHNKS
ncbi:aldo/keto reductase [Virgibacillus litoralis]|uniref:Aryl-alcohol dehydrogenase-like predicted oxidoreductase n=1 Tax=Virgibacillus litoralis TaxID=578221 RepID=A0ABS4HJQ6_9BACI|nr:aldo/keto reductase [Virgibacillus litoralis]MBP1950849.1 aryl-alcohol dehydrogenase-like predicted oxidoreductase [Virgibacillus litoralis]